jgi:hypothetical protein
VDRDLEPQSGQSKDYKIVICCFSSRHAALRRRSKDWLYRNHDNVSEWGDMWTVASVSWHYRKLTKRNIIIIIISLNVACSRHDTAEM